MGRAGVTLDLLPETPFASLNETFSDLSTLSDFGVRLDSVLVEDAVAQDLESAWQGEPRNILHQAMELDDADEERLRRLLGIIDFLEELWQRGPTPPQFWEQEWSRLQQLWASRGHWGAWAPFPAFATGGLPRLRDAEPLTYRLLLSRDIARRLPSSPRVQSLAYGSPLEIFLALDAVILGVLIRYGTKYGTFIECLRMIQEWPTMRAQAEANVERTRAEAREHNARASQMEAETQFYRALIERGVSPEQLRNATFSRQESSAFARLSALNIQVEIQEEEGE